MGATAPGAWGFRGDGEHISKTDEVMSPNTVGVVNTSGLNTPNGSVYIT